MSAIDEAYHCTLNQKPIKPDSEYVNSRDITKKCIINNSGKLQYAELSNDGSQNQQPRVQCIDDFSKAKFQMQSCIKTGEWKSFVPNKNNIVAKALEKFPNGNRNQALLDSINNGAKHDYYEFMKSNNKCWYYPPQRLFNNNTKRSCLPSPHFTHDIAPIYLG
jgi:hypothetical protein